MNTFDLSAWKVEFKRECICIDQKESEVVGNDVGAKVVEGCEIG